MNWIIARLREPSTWAGFAGMAATIGIAAPMYTAISTIGVGVASLLAILMKEKVPAE